MMNLQVMNLQELAEFLCSRRLAVLVGKDRYYDWNLVISKCREYSKRHVAAVFCPEAEVHPTGLGGVAEEIRNLDPVATVVVKTQSPYLLDYFEPYEVVAMTRYGRGREVAARLMADCPEVQRTSKHFGTGKIWVELGEDEIVFGQEGE